MADFSLVAELKANTSNFISGIKKGEESLKGFGGIVDKILGPKGKLVMAIATATTAALKLGQSMNKAMAEVAKGTGATGKELEKFRDTLNQTLVKGVNSSTKEIAKVMADVNTRFKLTGKGLANLTVDFDKFATVTEIDVKNSVEKVADVLAKWNIETEDATGLMDQLTVASQETGVSVETLLGELKQGQAIFSQLGMSATDTIAYLGTLKENGIDSSVALTGLSTALAKWSQEGKNARQEFKLVAEKIKNAKTETEALNISVANFGARSGAEMVKVLRNSANGADELKDKLIAAGGAVERTAEATRTSKEAFKGLGDTLKTSFGGFFEGFDNLFKGLADSLNNLFRILNPLIEPLFNAVKDILTMVGNVLSNLTSEIKNYVTEYSVAFNSIVAATNSAYQFIHGIMGYLEDSFGTVFGFIFSLLEGRFGLAWEYLKKNLLINVKFILDIVSNLVNAVKDQLNTLIEKGINPIIEKINWAQEKLGKKKTEKLSLIENFDLAGITGIDKKFEDVTKKIDTLSGKSKEKIVGDLGAVNTEFDSVSVSVQKGCQDLKEEIEKDVEDWSNVVKTSYDSITGAGNEMFTMLGENLAGAGHGYEDFAATATEALSEVLKGLAAQLSALAVTKAMAYSYGEAVAAAAGAAAALVAAGTLKAVSNSLKKVNDAAKSTNISLDEFVKRIQNIKETSFSKIGTFDKGVLEYSNTISKATKEMEKAYEEYDRLRNKHTEDDFYKSWGIFGRFDFVGYNKWLDEMQDALNTSNSWAEKISKANRDIVNSFKNLSESSKNIVEENSAVSYSYQELFKSINEVAKIKDIFKDIKVYTLDLVKYSLLMGNFGGPGDPSKTLYFQYQKYSAYLKTLTNNIKAQVQEMANDVYESMLSVGKDIGETFVSSIVDGVKKEDFMLSIKDYMKKQMTKLVILTDEFSDRIAGLGLKLISAMTSEDSKEPFEEIKNELSSLYDEAETKAKAVESVLTEVFGEVKDSTDEATLSISELKAQMADLYKGGGSFKFKKIVVKQLNDAISSQKEAIEGVIRSHYESLKTVGSSMAGLISSGFQEGLSKGDLKLSIKEWIRNQLIESTIYEVYAEKFAEIGAEIAGYMTHGHKAYLGQVSEQIDSIYEGMTKTLRSIDSVLDQTFGVKMEESAESVEEDLEKIEESFTKFEKAMRDFTDTISDLGGDVASNFISSLSSGLDTDSALLGFKKFLREYIIKAYVFTESMKSKIEKIGSLIGKTLDGSISKKELSDVANAVKATYGKLADSMKTVDTLLDSVFGKEKEEEIKDTTNTITKELSKIESAMKSFKETVSDLGGDIASNLIEGLSDGLSQSDFLSNMKDWIRKMLVQSIVYTEQMKSQIEEIGKAISNAISGGFTETSMHEIRRDLSFIFEQATAKMSGIDKVLGGVFDGFATGTNSASRGLAVVGEAGPELVNFRGGEQVLNAHNTQKALNGMGGSTNNFNVVFNNTQDTTAFAMMQQLKAYNRQMAINSII